MSDPAVASAIALQRDTLQLYRTLAQERADWGGALVLCCGERCGLSGAPAAAVIAGGAALAVDDDVVAMKAAQRRGDLDFVVRTLDEALRALKNEVRQKRALSVGLIAPVNDTLEEMVERGVQPDMHFIGTTKDAQRALPYRDLRPLMSRGMRTRMAAGENEASGECFFVAADFSALQAVDEALMKVLPADDAVRRRWVQRAPQYLRDARTGGRWIWLEDAELAGLAARGFSPESR